MLRPLCRYLSYTSWNQGVSKNIYNLWLLCMFFCCLQQLPLQEKSSFITSGKWNLSPFLPLIHSVTLTLCSTTLCSSSYILLSGFSFHLACAVRVNRLQAKLCLDLDVSGGGLSLISRISFLLFYFSICFLCVSICVLCNSHHSAISNPSSWRALRPEVMVCCLSLGLFLVF